MVMSEWDAVSIGLVIGGLAVCALSRCVHQRKGCYVGISAVVLGLIIEALIRFV